MPRMLQARTPSKPFEVWVDELAGFHPGKLAFINRASDLNLLAADFQKAQRRAAAQSRKDGKGRVIRLVLVLQETVVA